MDGHSEPAPTSKREGRMDGWMTSGQETVFRWISAP